MLQGCIHARIHDVSCRSGGGHGALRYCGIDVFFKRYFGNFLWCGIAVSSSPAVYGCSSFCLKVFGKRRPFTVLRYHLFSLSTV